MKAGKEYKCADCGKTIHKGQPYEKRTKSIGNMSTVINGRAHRDSNPLRITEQLCALCGNIRLTSPKGYAVGDFARFHTDGQRMPAGGYLRAGDYSGRITKIWSNGYSVKLRYAPVPSLFYTAQILFAQVTGRATGYCKGMQ